jgi:hypothetical protein
MPALERERAMMGQMRLRALQCLHRGVMRCREGDGSGRLAEHTPRAMTRRGPIELPRRVLPAA